MTKNDIFLHYPAVDSFARKDFSNRKQPRINPPPIQYLRARDRADVVVFSFRGELMED